MWKRYVAILVDKNLHIDGLGRTRTNNNNKGYARPHARLKINGTDLRPLLVVGRKHLGNSLAPACAHKHTDETRQDGDSFA